MGAAAPAVGRRRVATLAVLAGYTAIGFLYFGLRLLLDPGAQYAGSSADPQGFIWLLGWWPHAILHGENPFVTHALWAPTGVNLTWVVSIPGLALLFAPLTLVVGPVAAYNAAEVLLPALAAWTAFLLCRRVTRAFWPSVLGGYLFGFSSYILGQSIGHLNATGVFAIPLIALVVLRGLDEELGPWGVVVRLGPLAALQILISIEYAFTAGLALVAALALAYAFVPERRRAIAGLLVPLGASAALAAVLAAPYLYYAVSDFHPGELHTTGDYVADLANFAVPTHLIAVAAAFGRSLARSFPGNTGEQGAYLGIPALVIVALYLKDRLRTGPGRFLAACIAVGIVAALGAGLTVGGHRLFALPWSLVASWPAFDNVLTTRLTVYVALLAAVVVALWTASRRPGWLRRVLPALAVIAVLPNPRAGVWSTTFELPAFFTSAVYRDCLDPGENILPLPVGDRGVAMLWQAADDYRFSMAGGYISAQPPASFRTTTGLYQIANGYAVAPGNAGWFTEYIHGKGVTSVILDATNPASADFAQWSAALDTLAPSRRIGGVLVYRFSQTPPAC